MPAMVLVGMSGWKAHMACALNFDPPGWGSPLQTQELSFLDCSHISRLKDQKCQLLANRFIFTHKQISMRMNTKLLEERDKYITYILSLLSDFC